MTTTEHDAQFDKFEANFRAAVAHVKASEAAAAKARADFNARWGPILAELGIAINDALRDNRG